MYEIKLQEKHEGEREEAIGRIVVQTFLSQAF